MSHLTAQSGLAGAGQVWIEHDGSWVEASLEDAAVRRHNGAAEPVWVRVAEAGDFAAVAERLGIADADVARAGHRGPGGLTGHPHLERLPDGGLYLASPTLSYLEQTQDVHTGILTILLSHDVILTTEGGEAGIQDATADRLNSPDLPFVPGARRVLAVLLLELVRTAGDVEVGIGEAVADAERGVFSPDGPDQVQRIYTLKREIAEARRALVPFSAHLLELVADEEDVHRDGQARPWLQRLERSTDRLDRHLEGHDRLLGDMLAATLSRVSLRQNEDMRKISAWAAIAAVPTLVAGVYGMNFQYMPELSWTFGYPLAIAAMGTICLILFRVFKRSGWL